MDHGKFVSSSRIAVPYRTNSAKYFLARTSTFTTILVNLQPMTWSSGIIIRQRSYVNIGFSESNQGNQEGLSTIMVLAKLDILYKSKGISRIANRGNLASSFLNWSCHKTFQEGRPSCDQSA